MTGVSGEASASANQGVEGNQDAEAAVDRENKIRERAYWIWLREGLPDGRGPEHWRQAEKEVDAEAAAAQKP